MKSFFNPLCILMDFSIKLGTVKSGRSIAHVGGSHEKLRKSIEFFSVEIDFCHSKQ